MFMSWNLPCPGRGLCSGTRERLFWDLGREVFSGTGVGHGMAAWLRAWASGSGTGFWFWNAKLV